jgi:hypothetical protein
VALPAAFAGVSCVFAGVYRVFAGFAAALAAGAFAAGFGAALVVLAAALAGGLTVAVARLVELVAASTFFVESESGAFV